MSTAAYLGIDIGTSGIRASCIDDDQQELVSHHIAFAGALPDDGKNEQDPRGWQLLLDRLIIDTGNKLHQLEKPYRIRAIAIEAIIRSLKIASSIWCLFMCISPCAPKPALRQD